MSSEPTADASVVALDTLDGTAMLPFDGAPRVVRLSLAAGASRPRHSHPGHVVVCHVMEGTVDLQLGGDSVEVEAGEVARFDGEQEVAPRALEDARALLVLVAR